MSVPNRLFSVFCTLDRDPADIADIRLAPAHPEKPPALDLHWRDATQPSTVYYTSEGEAQADLRYWQTCDRTIRLVPLRDHQIGARDFSPRQVR